MLGYPQLFPEREAAQHCVRLHGAFHVTLFDDGEQNYLRHEADIIDDVIAGAAARAGSFHPDTAGQHAYAALLQHFLATRPGKRNKAGFPLDPKPV